MWVHTFWPRYPNQDADSRADTRALAASITRAASRQTYYTIRFLVDRDRVADAYRAYAYFRWVDDYLDRDAVDRIERLTFLRRQQRLVENCYRGEPPAAPTPHEQILIDLVRSDSDPNSGLHAYIDNMMAVMAFDAARRERTISEAELTAYSRWLATAVTEAMHFFIGHNKTSPRGDIRYHAVIAAHITHMLRDTFEDAEIGYVNVPDELLAAHHITPLDVDHEAYVTWVKTRVELARSLFANGRQCLARVQCRRCRIAGYAYMARFERVLHDIERNHYHLSHHYTKTGRLAFGLTVLRSVLADVLSGTRWQIRRPVVLEPR